MTLCFLIVVKEDAFKQSFPCVYLMGLCMNDWGFPGSAVVKNLPANAGGARDMGWIPGLGRSLGVGNGNPLQYSCLENPMDRETCQVIQSIGLQRVGHVSSNLVHTHRDGLKGGK